MKKSKLSLLGLGMLLSVTGCGAEDIIHNVDQNLAHELPSKQVTIKFWHCLGHEKGENLWDVIEAFNREYAGKYKVVERNPGGGYSGLHKAIKNAIRAGSGIPTMAIGYPDSFAEYMGTKENRSNILRLNNFYTDSIYGYDPDGNKDELVNVDFVENYFNEGQGYQFKGLWSLPMYKSTEVMFYNLDYFSGKNELNEKKFGNTTWWQEYAEDNFKDEDGDDLVYYSTKGHDLYAAALATLKAKVIEEGGYAYTVPETWDQMVATSKQIIADRKTMEVYSSGNYGVGYDSDANLIITQLAQRGYKYTTNDNVKNKKDHIQFNNQNTIGLVSELNQLYKDHVLLTKGTLDSTGTKYTNDEFTGGEDGTPNIWMCVGSTGGSNYQETSKFAVGVAHVPYSNNNPLYIQQGPSICFFDHESEEVNLGAWLFYQKLANAQTNAELATENSYDPVRVSSFDTDTYKDYKADRKVSMLSEVPWVTEEIKDKLITSPVFVGSSTAREEIGKLLAYVRFSGLSAKAAVEKAYKATVNKTK